MRLPVTLALAIPLNFLFSHIYITQRHMPIALKKEGSRIFLIQVRQGVY